jgi:hypothetical protein
MNQHEHKSQTTLLPKTILPLFATLITLSFAAQNIRFLNIPAFPYPTRIAANDLRTVEVPMACLA